MTQTNPYEQEVKVERSVEAGVTRKKADYAFSAGSNCELTRFFAEAKRPSKDCFRTDDYVQAAKYGWFIRRNTLFSVLTSFDDFVER